MLDRVDPGSHATLALSVNDEGVEATIGPVRLNGELDREPAGGDETLTLGRVLRTVVDEVAVDGDRVRLTKRVGADVR